jgi:hypothetical protein
MNETDASRSTAPNGTWFPKLLSIIPPLLVAKLLRDGHWALFFASFVPGALLTALWPPRTYRSMILGLATATAMVILVIVAHFAGWK